MATSVTDVEEGFTIRNEKTGKLIDAILSLSCANLVIETRLREK
jgi:hypothetical protein